MQTSVLIIIVALAGLALGGWLRSWRLSHRAPAAVAAKPATDDILAKVQSEASHNLARSIQHASELFQKNLTVQALKINDELEGLAKQRLHKQIDDFTAVLSDLTSAATSSVAQLEALVEQRRLSLAAGMATEVLDEKQRTLEQFYQHLSDIVAGYIVESLGSDVDLSGQLPFVLKVLEQNKDAIKQDLLSDY